MSLIYLLVVLILLGAILYLVQRLPIDATIKTLIYVVIVIFLLLWLVGILGFDITIPVHRR